MSIELQTTQVLMRYISEWDPREAAHTKGGYLEGQIKVPDFNGAMTMVIQTYPAADADPLISTHIQCPSNPLTCGQDWKREKRSRIGACANIFPLEAGF